MTLSSPNSTLTPSSSPSPSRASSRWTFALILALAIGVRLIGAWFAPHPGISDSNHYYNLAKNVSEGRGLVVDYLWHYHYSHADITHPEDYWMPLPALYPAFTMLFVPNNLFVALLPSVAFGGAVVALAYGVAWALGASERVRQLAMICLLFLPDLMLNSARTDTTISYVFYMGCAMVCFYLGIKQRPLWLLLAGVCGGLAYLTRQDAILLLPSFAVAWVGARFLGYRVAWRWVLLLPLGWLLVVSPYLYRNYSLFGSLTSNGSGRTLFMTSFNDQFTYGRTLNLEHYLAWGIPNILANIATMALANVRTIVHTLDVLLPVVGFVGAWGIIAHKDREKGLMFLLPLVMVLALLAFYTVVTPFHTMGGSFKKSYQFTLPFWAFLGAYALDRYVQPSRMAMAFAVIGAMVAGMNAFQLVRTDFDASKRFNDSVIALDGRLQDVGDVNGDGEIIVMTQDPYILNYHGYRALMLPSDPLDMILEASYRYNVDYIILPANREALNGFYDNEQQDARLTWLEGVGNYQLLAVRPILP